MSTIANLYYESSIQHFGIRGQKWGIRRYQNKDGSLTAAGRHHQQKEIDKIRSKAAREQYKMTIERTRIQEERKTALIKAKLEEEKKSLMNEKSGKSDNINRLKPKTPVADLSDEELNRIINRINMEKRYSELVREPERKKDYSFMREVGKSVVSGLMSSASKEAGKAMGKKIGKSLFNESSDDDKKKKTDDD